MFSWEEKPFQSPNRARGPWEEIHTSDWWLVKPRASPQTEGQLINSGRVTLGKRSVMPTASPTAARESSMSSLFLFFFFCLQSCFHSGIWEGNANTAVLRPWWLATHPPYRISVFSVHIYAARVDLVTSKDVTHVNSSILCKHSNKKKHHHRLLQYFSSSHSSNFLRLESLWSWWKTGSNWGRKQNRYKLTPATWNRIGHSASRDTFKTSACLCACLLSETFAVAVALPALSHPRLMVLVLCNLAITVHHLSNAGLFFSPFARHNRRNLNYGDSVIVVSCCFF